MSIEVHPETRLKCVISPNGTAVTGAKALCFVMAAFVVLAPSMLAAQAPVSSASTAGNTLSQAPDAIETNESSRFADQHPHPKLV
jgi:hypothetical protein